ncbi:MAG: hypothetical protein RIT45_2467 [Pseudomonadota bacterium]|jgi:isopentenyl-diphosphate delta-isomerase
MEREIEAARKRKDEHLRIAAEEPSVQRPGAGTGLEALQFEMLSLPELDLDAVDTRVTLLGKALRAPLLVGAMTGGTADAGAVNRILAAAAERAGVGFCLGSQRPMLDGDEDARRSFALREVAPSTLICGNIGAIQLRDAPPGAIDMLAESVGANAMFVHLNPLQEAVQPEGDRDWRGVFEALAHAVGEATTPVLVKEVGAGLSRATLEALALTGIAGVETAGVGGTSWSQIEALRHGGRTPRAIAGSVLAGFGTPTAQSVRMARAAFPGRVVVGSGGLRNGLEAAKCIALGADAVAMAWPFLVAARSGRDPERAIEAVVTEIEGVIETLRITMFLVGTPTISHLASAPLQPRPVVG